MKEVPSLFGLSQKNSLLNRLVESLVFLNSAGHSKIRVFVLFDRSSGLHWVVFVTRNHGFSE